MGASVKKKARERALDRTSEMMRQRDTSRERKRADEPDALHRSTDEKVSFTKTDFTSFFILVASFSSFPRLRYPLFLLSHLFFSLFSCLFSLFTLSLPLSCHLLLLLVTFVFFFFLAPLSRICLSISIPIQLARCLWASRV